MSPKEFEEFIKYNRKKLAKALGTSEEDVANDINKAFLSQGLMEETGVMQRVTKDYVDLFKDFKYKDILIPTAIWAILSNFYKKEKIIEILDKLKKNVTELDDKLDKPFE